MLLPTDSWNEETHVGPSSEEISIPNFVLKARSLGVGLGPSTAVQAEWDALPEDSRLAIEGECDIGDLFARDKQIRNDPEFKLALDRYKVETILDIAKSNPMAVAKDCKEWVKRASGERVARQAEGNHDDSTLRQNFEHVKLSCWKPQPRGFHFVGRPSTRFLNSMKDVKAASYPTADPTYDQVIISVSIYRHNPLRGPSAVTLASRHLLLASHTLADLQDVMSCSSNDIPQEIIDSAGNVSNYLRDTRMEVGACVVGFGPAPSQPSDGKDLVYGDGMFDTDYAERYVKTYQAFTEPEDESAERPELPVKVAPQGMANTPFHTLSIRLNYPYMYIHQGNCQHPFVIDEIRLRQAADPPGSQFPFTTFTGIVSRPKCNICTKFAASQSIVGDGRLGESLSLVCDTCWDKMGYPSTDKSILVVPLTMGVQKSRDC